MILTSEFAITCSSDYQTGILYRDPDILQALWNLFHSHRDLCQPAFQTFPIIADDLPSLFQFVVNTRASADLIISKLATTSSTGGLLLALQRAIVTARPKGRYRKHFCWPAIKRYYSNLLVSILLLALLYTFELLHLLYCQSFQHNIL